VFESVSQMIAPQAASRGLRFTVSGCPDPLVVWADRAKVQQILLNLLSNAIKFTRRGGHVWISYEVDETTVRIHIQDDGIGIPADKIESIFEPYVQLASTGTTNEIGWGLGLAISRDLARAMGGDLLAALAPDHGTIFTLTLPRSTRIAPMIPRG